MRPVDARFARVKHTRRMGLSAAGASGWWPTNLAGFVVTAGPILGLAGLVLTMLAAPVRADFLTGVEAANEGDYEIALTAFEEAAESGDLLAQYNIAAMYHAGLGVPQDYLKALRWYMRAVRGGLPPELYKLDDGMLVAQNADGRWIPESPLRRAKVASAPQSNPVVAPPALARKRAAEPGPRSVPDPDVDLAGAAPSLPADMARQTAPNGALSASTAAPPAEIPLGNIGTGLTPDLARALEDVLATPPTEDQILEIQRILTVLGYDAGPADGVVGPRTKQAIQKFETDLGLRPSRDLTARQLRKLIAMSYAERDRRVRDNQR